jgi:hypothetical protein
METIIDPVEMLIYVVEELQQGRMSIERANEVGKSMPEGYQFYFRLDSELFK